MEQTIITDIINEAIGLAMKKKSFTEKRQIKVSLKAICIFKSKANDYQLKLIADEAYIAPLPHPRINCNKKKINAKIVEHWRQDHLTC